MNTAASDENGRQRIVTEIWRRGDLLFSDEAKISFGTNGVLHVWCHKGEEYLLQCCDFTVKHSPSVMVWGSMSYYGVGSLASKTRRPRRHSCLPRSSR